MEPRNRITWSTARQIARPLPLLILAVLLIVGNAANGAASAVPASAQAGATPVAVPPSADPCPDDLNGPDSEPWVRAELFFGTTAPDGTAFSEEEWLDFLDAEITPRFPAGLTVLTGLGQWQNDDGTITQERSQVLIILYPTETARESSVLLEEIRDAYEDQFDQDSVLRTDAAPVCTSF